MNESESESERTFKVSFEYSSFVKAPDAKTAVEMAHPLLSFYLEKHPEKLTVIEMTG